MTPRKVWLALKTPLTMLVLLGIVLGSAYWAYKQITTPTPKKPSAPCVTTSIGPDYLPRHAVVRIYNASNINGVGKKVAATFRADKFSVIKVANADSTIDGVQISGISADSPEVVLVRSYFDKSAQFVADPLKLDHTVDITLGKSFTSLSTTPLKSVPLKDGKACLPPPLTSTTTATAESGG
jgi:hypothetical protein